MSGIVGLYDRQGDAADPDRVETMHERIAHRGPDGGDTWRDDRVGLGHQLLATTPEADHESQPRPASADRECDAVVTADLRLDNRAELLSACDFPGDPDVATDGTGAVDASVAVDETTARDDGVVTDPELLLAAYDRWGTECVEHLVGAFAFAIWDADRERLFCARDHFGVKPFYYRSTDRALAFASELKAILALPSVSPPLDDVWVGDFLTGLFEDESNTCYESIRRLPPAHAMTVDADDVERWRYWDLDPTRTVTLDSDAAYERRFRELFEQAVRCRLRTTDSVGSSLSGGMDSSSITVMARDLLPSDEPLHTFSNVYDEAESSDEREFIETVIERDGIESHYVVSDDVPALVDLADVRASFDRPPHNTMHSAKWERTKRADEAGVGIVLEGALGDSAVDYGLGLLPELLRTGRWRHLLRECRAMGEVVGAGPHQVLLRHALEPLVPEPLDRRYRQLRGEPVLEAKANSTLDPTFVDRIGLRDRYKRLQSTGSVLRRSARRWQRRSLLSGQIAATLETSDLMHAAFGLEPRYPFTDVRLVEFSLAMPPSQQLKDGWTRSIIRRSLADLLPEKIQWRPWKTSMSEGFWRSLSLEQDRLDELADDPGLLAEYLDRAELRAAADRFADDPASRDARALWRALSLSTWFDSE